MVIKGLTTNFFPPKELQNQKRYLPQGLFNPWVAKMRKFICRVK